MGSGVGASGGLNTHVSSEVMACRICSLFYFIVPCYRVEVNTFFKSYLFNNAVIYLTMLYSDTMKSDTVDSG
jgi:hypothetical protein